MDMHQYAVEEAIRVVALADSLDEDGSGGHVVMTEADLPRSVSCGRSRRVCRR